MSDNATIKPISAKAGDRAASWWRSWRPRWPSDPGGAALASLHVVSLFNLAVAQPIYNLIALEPMVLVIHRARPWEILLLAIGLSVILPLLLVTTLLLIRRVHRQAAVVAFLLLMFALLMAMAIPGWKRTILLPAAWIVSLGVFTAVGGTWAYARWNAVRLLVTYASIGVLLFPALFLLRPPVSNLVFPNQGREEVAVEAENPAPVIMVLFDEFSASTLLNSQRQIDAEKFPNFAQLADEATWYRNATTVSGYTQYAVPSLLTGCRPRDLPATTANFPRNLFTMLADQYDLTVFEPYTTLCPVELDPTAVRHTSGQRIWRLAADLSRIYGQFLLPFDMAPSTLSRYAQEYHKYSFDRQRQKTKGLIRYNWSQSRAEQFEHFVETLRPTEQPVLYFGHIVLPHSGYEFLPSGRRHLTQIDAPDNYWSKDDWYMAQQRQQNMLQVVYVDRLLGQLVERLKSTGLYDRCLLVIVADHGITFRPGAHGRDATKETAPDVMWIPLFIKAPHQTAGVVSDRNMELIDVLPTMCDALQIRNAGPFDGISAADPQQSARPTKTLFQTEGRSIELSGDFAEKNSTLSEHLRWFKTPGGVDALYRMGPHSQLVGQSLDRLPQRGKPRVEVTIENEPDSQNVHSDLELWPCFYWGQASGEETIDGHVPLAVAVNGRIEAVTRTITSSQGKTYWQALVPEESIRMGDNKLEVFVIRTRGKTLTLEPTHTGSD